jgi:hypothetical protein
MTALAFVNPIDRWRLRATLIGGQLFPSVELANLRFVHIATWGVVNHPGRPWHGHLLFVSNFSGDSDEYIANFADAITARVNRAFGRCVGFPGAQPSPGFIGYVRQHDHPAQVYYSFYPQASVRDVGAALRAKPEIDALSVLADKAPPRQFARSYVQALHDVQPRGATAIRPKKRLQLTWEAWHKASVSSLTAIFTLTYDGAAKAKVVLEAFDAVAADVFKDVAGTHFARLVNLPGDGQQKSSLLFSAQIDGTGVDYVNRLTSHPELDSVWRLCEGYPGLSDAGRFTKWFEWASVPSSLFITEAPWTTRDEVSAALSRHERLLNFAATNQNAKPEDLTTEFALSFP